MSNLGQLVQNYGLPLVILGGFVWASFIKDPPIFVSWREHKSSIELSKTAVETSAKLVDQNGQLLGLLKGK